MCPALLPQACNFATPHPRSQANSESEAESEDGVEVGDSPAAAPLGPRVAAPRRQAAAKATQAKYTVDDDSRYELFVLERGGDR